jgi:hypothetical protein
MASKYKVSAQQRNQQSEETAYRMGENLFCYSSHREFISRIYEELKT